MMDGINLLLLENEPIYSQLCLEEAILRADESNWCIVNQGSSPAIVMGISGKKEVLIHEENIQKTPLTIVKRFTGGGTVVVDEETVFITFVFNASFLNISVQPEVILRWSESFYQGVFEDSRFALRENDYVFEEKKIGGNAQYLQKNRFLHHTSFLWDYKKEYMDLLLYPPKVPRYRQGRSHEDFVCRLKEYMPSKQRFIEKFMGAVKTSFNIREVSKEEVLGLLTRPYRRTTCIL